VRRTLDRFQNSRIGSATANVAVYRFNDLVVTGFRDSAEECSRCNYHAGGAVAALERTLFKERLLNSGEIAAVRQSLDGYDTRVRRSRDWSQTGPCGAAIEEDGTCATLTLAAAIFGSREIKPIAQDRQKRLFRRRLNFNQFGVDVELKFGHDEFRVDASLDARMSIAQTGDRFHCVDGSGTLLLDHEVVPGDDF